MKRIIQFVREHFSRLQRKPKASFLFQAWFESVVFAFAVACVAQALFPAGPREDLIGKNAVQLCLLVLGIGPLFETIAFQCLPCEFSAAVGVRRWLRIVFSVVPFAIMHYMAGVPTVVGAGFVAGFYFAFTYERWRRESIFVGIVMTFLLHSSFNLVGAIGMLLMR